MDYFINEKGVKEKFYDIDDLCEWIRDDLNFFFNFRDYEIEDELKFYYKPYDMAKGYIKLEDYWGNEYYKYEIDYIELICFSEKELKNEFERHIEVILWELIDLEDKGVIEIIKTYEKSKLYRLLNRIKREKKLIKGGIKCIK